MKKTYKMFLAFVLCMIGAMNVNAETETVSLDQVAYGSWDGWGADAVMTAAGTPAWAIGEASGQPYGDPSVNAFADLSAYDKLIVEASDGTPRFMFNRDIAEGQFNADEKESHLIEYPKCQGTWAEKYFTTEAGAEEGHTIYTVDLKQMVKDKGFAHLHAIKGANWANVTIYSMVVVRQVKKNVTGWTSVITNGDFEGTDVSSFALAIDAVNNDGVQDPTIEENIGKNDSHGIAVSSLAGATETWATQLFVKSNEFITAGTKVHFKMDVKAENAAEVTTGTHAAPRDYLCGGFINKFVVSDEWNTIDTTFVVPSTVNDKEFAGFQSIAFDLNNDKDNANKFFFDNIVFEVYKLGTLIEFSDEIVQIDFGFETNIPDLVKAANVKRLLYPTDCVTVTVNGEAKDVLSVEAFEDGRFYIFFNEGEGVEDDDEVVVSFKNPTDAAYQIVYASGAVKGQVVKDITNMTAEFNEEVEDGENAYAYDYLKPTLMKADPEDGSFNLPNSISEFKAWFDKEVKADEIVATLNDEPLAVTPNEGLAKEFTFTRTGADLATGAYKLHITKAAPKAYLNKDNYCDTTMVINIGKVSADPNDVEETVMTDDFAASGASWIVTADGTDENPGGIQDANSGSGCRLMHNQNQAQNGNGFANDILYLGTRKVQGVALYGTKDDAKLNLKLKDYHLTLGAAKWDGNGAARQLTVQVFAEGDVDVTTGAVVEGKTPVVEETQAIVPDFKTSTNATRFDVLIPVKSEGNYIIRLVTSDANGNAAGYGDASAIGEVKVQYLPNTIGAEWVRLLTAALDDAKKIRDKYVGERYAGEAFSALDGAINTYSAEMENYTNPSAYQNAADNLKALGEAMQNHGTLCNDYDTAIKNGIDVVRKNEMPNGDPNQATKFVKTEMFAQLKDAVDKYHGTSQWVNVADTIADPEAAPVWELVYSFDELTDDAQLTAAVAELKEIADKAGKLFTEGESKLQDGGIKVLVDRLRRGAETLKSIGAPADDTTVVNALNALEDDDELAQTVKDKITIMLYDSLANANNTLFAPTLDDNFNEIVPEFDMTAFVKNGNTYVNAGEKAAPGWDVTGKVGYWLNWGASHDNSIVPEDLSFTIYQAEGRAEQTITDLPAGIYTVTIDAARWDNPRNDDNTWKADVPECATFAYIKTGKTPEVEAGLEENRETNFAATETLDYYGQYVMHHDCVFENVEITDGKLVLGVNFASDGGQYFFDHVLLTMTGAAKGFDYAKAKEDYMNTGIEPAQAAAKVRAIEVYDLNGMRTAKATRGLNIVKKYMSDGSVRIQKVIVK